MNISELNQALHEIADEVTDDSKTRLASVTRRVQIARRGKVAGTIVTTCAIVLAFVLLPHWGELPGSDTPAASGHKDFGSLSTVSNDHLLVYTDAGGVRLLGEKVAAPGVGSVSVSVTPTNGNLGWTQLCSPSGPPGLRYHLTVNGKPVPSAVVESLRYTGASQISQPNTTCDTYNPPMQVQRRLSVSPTGNMNAWKTFNIQPDVPATFTLSVTSTDDADGRAALARASLRLGVFEIPRHPVQAHGVWVDRHLVDPVAASGAFTLIHRRFVTVGPGRTALKVPVPNADRDQQIYVRTFVVRGEGSGVQLQPGVASRNELAVASGTWDVEKSIAAGTSTVRAALAVVPADTERRVVMLVFAKYQ